MEQLPRVTKLKPENQCKNATILALEAFYSDILCNIRVNIRTKTTNKQLYTMTI